MFVVASFCHSKVCAGRVPRKILRPWWLTARLQRPNSSKGHVRLSMKVWRGKLRLSYVAKWEYATHQILQQALLICLHVSQTWHDRRHCFDVDLDSAGSWKPRRACLFELNTPILPSHALSRIGEDWTERACVEEKNMEKGDPLTSP